jgi:hypothetical protein
MVMIIMIVEQQLEWLLGRGNRSYQRTPASVTFCPLQIPHDLIRARTLAADG